MPINNTTQNKEELEWRQRLRGWLEQVNLLEQKPNVQGGQLVFKGTRVTLTSLINFIIDVRDKSISQAHQSGIEEERKRIKTNIGFLRQWINEKPDNLLVTNEDIEEWLFNFEPLRGKNEVI